MRKLISMLLITSAVLCASVRAESGDAVRQAQEAAQRWFASADAGLYQKTWEQAAIPFQQAVTEAEWETALRTVRAPIGDVQNRSLISATFTEKLPGAPKGQYVVMQYASKYTKKADVTETVIPMLSEDGIWRVSGYFVK